MTLDNNDSICPFCQKKNLCAAEKNAGCWCYQTKVPTALIALVPIKQREKACICSACITRFNADPEQFHV